MDTALYMRVSTSEQNLHAQERELRGYCRIRGWRKIAVYADKISGATATRPALHRLLQDMRAGRIERLLCYKLDRLGRSLTHLALIVDEMTRLEVPLICTTQGIDTSETNPSGRFQLAVLIAVAEFERDIIRERVNAGLAAARERGVKLGRPSTLAHRRPQIAKLKKSGFGIRQIARKLHMPVSSVHWVLQSLSNG